MTLIKCIFIIGTLLSSYVYGIPIDNGIVGGPEIECGPSDIGVYFNAEKPFEGHVYVKGQYQVPECHTQDRGRTSTGIKISFDSCNLSRIRSLNPRGIFVSTVVVMSFHPTFMTKIDRAYRIQCFYMEADKTVSAEIEVSRLTTGLQTQFVPMPVCRYEILDGSPTASPIRFALVGQSVYHKWTCDTDTQDTFCMRVYSCYVDDGNGDTINLIDLDGCSIDRYPMDLMAGQEAHVFKYADRSQLYFQCQIEITVKEPEGTCFRPTCPASSRASSRRGRRATAEGGSYVGSVDVRSQDIDTMDLDFNQLPASPPSNTHAAHKQSNQPASKSTKAGSNHQKYCLNSSVSSILVVLIVLGTIVTVAMSSVIFVSSSIKKNL